MNVELMFWTLRCHGHNHITAALGSPSPQNVVCDFQEGHCVMFLTRFLHFKPAKLPLSSGCGTEMLVTRSFQVMAMNYYRNFTHLPFCVLCGLGE